MASLRPARCYKKIKRAFTRFSRRRPKKSFVKGVPAPRIHQFVMGDKRADFSITLHLVSKNNAQIRSNALEAARVAATKQFSKYFGDKGFRLQIRPFPHHVLRENALATGAGADRFSQGMRHSYGKPIGQAAQVKTGQIIITAKINDANKIDKAKIGLKRAGMKLPLKWSIQVE
ncbi:MAG: 50S ribosomal protein L16 [Candidatus Aenigmarchaeota archaeon]|nr:50S ribosomal protein L16 [Candidatus Aenigmarchaeota archaeon]